MPHLSVYFRVPDVDAFVKRAEDLGGRGQTFDLPVARMAVVADAQGAVFTVVQYEREEQGIRIKDRKRKR
jgi:predicted enzyme related to lactoylglutathione lyase